MHRFFRKTRLYCTAVNETNRTKPVTTKESKLNFKKLKYQTKVPISPNVQKFPIKDKPVIDNAIIQLLERLALVNLESKEALSTLESSIEFAEKITLIETTNVLPLYTLLEDQTLYLRGDSVIEGNCREEILRGAKVTEEDYFVSPPGNIPLHRKDRSFSENVTVSKENASNAKGYISNFNLLINGLKYSEQLLKHWQRTHFLDKEVSFKEMNLTENYFCETLKTRHEFIHTKEFHESIRYLLGSKSKNHEQPLILKSVHTALNQESLEGLVTSFAKQHTYLETLYLTPTEKGFSAFFNKQRACKIWWMRFSADPSKYFVNPYTFEAASNLAQYPGTQSITIKSKLPYASLDVESITVIPLHTARLDADFVQFLKNNNKTGTIPTVIRSVIDLQAATGAVLFDSVDNDRENTLLLNRKLAPFQCVITCYHEGKQLKDLEDLCLHIRYVLSRSGLRLMGEKLVFTKSLQELESEICKFDSLGVPYLLIISGSTLQNGLLKLRNRDTTLEETIHVSDLPNYLLQIFS